MTYPPAPTTARSRHAVDADHTVSSGSYVPRSAVCHGSPANARTGTPFTTIVVACAVLTACVPAKAVGQATDGTRIVVVASGTANEPRPAVTERVRALLLDAANSTNVSNHDITTSSVALVSSADGARPRDVLLSPRRADGSIEHGMSRPRLVAGNVAAAVDTIASTAAGTAGLDLLRGITDATRGVQPATLVVISNGLSTSGALDLRRVGWEADPTEVVRQLSAADQLPELRGWTVVFSGLGDTAGAQPPLPNPARKTLVRYWRAICAASRAKRCDVDDSRLPPETAQTEVATPVVPVPGVSSVVGSDRRVTTTVAQSALGFAGDSADLSADGRDLLVAIAGAIGDTRPVRVVGFGADPPGSTAAGRQQLAALRARTVADVLGQLGIKTTAVGVGTPPGETAMVGDRFDEPAAGRMRRVEISY